MVWDILLDALRSSVLVTGLVVVMMMLIECVNIDSQGSLLGGLKRSRFTQVLFPPCWVSSPAVWEVSPPFRFIPTA